MDQDTQEARSIKYTVGLRLALLKSGNWAVFHGGMYGLEELVITSDLQEPWLHQLAQQENASRATRQSAYEARQLLGWAEPQNLQTDKSIEEIGL